MEFFTTPHTAKSQRVPHNYKSYFVLQGFARQPLTHIDIKVYSTNNKTDKSILSRICQVTLTLNGHIFLNKMIDHKNMASFEIPKGFKKLCNKCIYLKVRSFETPQSDNDNDVFCEAVYFYDNQWNSDEEDYHMFDRRKKINQ